MFGNNTLVSELIRLLDAVAPAEILGETFNDYIQKALGSRVREIADNPDAIAFARKLCVPSKSYAGTITRINGWLPDGTVREPLAKLCGVAHITGGGVWGKLADILPFGIGADLNNMSKPANVLLEVQEMSQPFPKLRLTDHQGYGTLHGGYGMMSVCADDVSANIVIREAQKDGVQAEIIGYTILSAKNEIVIKSRYATGQMLSSLNPN